MKNISDKSCRENQNAHLMFNNFFFKSCRLRVNMVKYDRAKRATDVIIIRRRKKFNNTDTHSEYVSLIAFPLP